MADSFVATVRRNAYVDSITLLQVSAELLSLAGVLDAALVMATDLNRQVLHEAGLLVDDAHTAGPNDLVIAVRATDDALANSAVQQAAGRLADRGGTTGGGMARRASSRAPCAAPTERSPRQTWRSSPYPARSPRMKPARPWRMGCTSSSFPTTCR